MASASGSGDKNFTIDDAGFTVSDNEDSEYSPDGKYLAIAGADGIAILDSVTLTTVSTIVQKRIQALHWSPLGNFLLTWHKQAADEGELLVSRARAIRLTRE